MQNFVEGLLQFSVHHMTASFLSNFFHGGFHGWQRSLLPDLIGKAQQFPERTPNAVTPRATAESQAIQLGDPCSHTWVPPPPVTIIVTIILQLPILWLSIIT